MKGVSVEGITQRLSGRGPCFRYFRGKDMKQHLCCFSGMNLWIKVLMRFKSEAVYRSCIEQYHNIEGFPSY